jgi:hypothetical protein
MLHRAPSIHRLFAGVALPSGSATTCSSSSSQSNPGDQGCTVGVFARSDERQKESAPIEPLAARSGSVFGPPALLYLARRPVRCVSTNVE